MLFSPPVNSTGDLILHFCNYRSSAIKQTEAVYGHVPEI